MAKKVKETEADNSAQVVNVKDELSTIISKGLKTKFKGEIQAWDLSSGQGSPTEVSDWVSTGNVLLDLAISNRPNGGYPVGKIVELTGLEASGKSLLAAHAIAETQKKGGLGVFIDTESAVSPEFFEAIGVDMTKFMYIPIETLEDIYETIEHIITTVRSSDKDRLVTIVVDSVAGATTKAEQESNYDKDGWATTKAIINSKAMRKINNLIAKQKILLIFTNQLRQKLNAMAFADPYTTSGGKAIGFHASVRIRLSSTGKIKKKAAIAGQDAVIGNSTKAEIIKNRVGPPFRKAEFNIYYASGVDPYSGWPDLLEKLDILKKDGQSLRVVGHEDIKFKKTEFNKVMNEMPDLKEELYKRLCDGLIMQYKNTKELTVNDADVDVDENDTLGDDV